jgi:hypothetical protein
MRHSIPFQCSTGPRSCPQRRRPPTGLVSVGRRSPPIVGVMRRASPIPPAVEHKLGERRGEREDLKVEEAIEQALLRGLDGSGGLVTDAVPEAHVHEQTEHGVLERLHHDVAGGPLFPIGTDAGEEDVEHPPPLL